MSRRITFFLVLISMFTLVGAGTYKWVDEQGQTHYSDAGPEGISQEIKPQPEPSGEETRHLREEMKASLERQRRRDEARSAKREQQRLGKITKGQEEKKRIESCVFAQGQIEKLKFQRPVYRVLGKGEQLYLDYFGRQAILGMDGEMRTIDSVEGERIYVEDSQRATEIERYQNDVKLYCGKRSADLRKQDKYRLKKYSAQMCEQALKNLESLRRPNVRTPSSVIEGAKANVKRHCED